MFIANFFGLLLGIRRIILEPSYQIPATSQEGQLLCTKSSAFSDIQPRHSFSIMDEGERYIKGKIQFLNERDSGDLALQKAAFLNVKTDVSDMEVEENHYHNLKRSFSNSLNYI